MYKPLIDSSQFIAADEHAGASETAVHTLLQHSIYPPFPEHCQYVLLAMGCFWGAERRFWQQPGVWTSAVGYAGGHLAKPSYPQVCTGLTGHTEAVLVVFDPAQISFAELLQVFWQSHDPTQGMRQGNDVGSQYRSAIYCMDQQQLEQAQASCAHYQARLTAAGGAVITTEIGLAPVFYYAEAMHQQYLVQNPNGYCGLRGTGVMY
ncbi:MAG: peptide-methionine (S)-S-oxide reductase MsrA [Gammaproteobacteria bacterium]|nr:peptide-methionine (S)-S-oxide reductase MsrA [Gammaproteobacteria bacterium]